jgi:gamma-glutamylputrescine oxidase
MGMGAERFPLIKEVSPNVYCAVRLGGMGVAIAPVAAQKVAELMY